MSTDISQDEATPTTARNKERRNEPTEIPSDPLLLSELLNADPIQITDTNTIKYIDRALVPTPNGCCCLKEGAQKVQDTPPQSIGCQHPLSGPSQTCAECELHLFINCPLH